MLHKQLADNSKVWGYATNLGATAFVVEGLGQVKKAMDFKDSTADAFNDFEVVRKALKIIEEQTGISGDKLIGLGGDLKNVKDNAFDFDGQLQTVETTLENLGISSDTFKQALKQAMEESDTATNSHVKAGINLWQENHLARKSDLKYSKETNSHVNTVEEVTRRNFGK